MDIRGFEVVSAFEEQDINLPTRKTTESAGYDIECAEAVTLEPGQVVLVPTGIKAFMAYDEYLAIHIRSSMAIKRHLALVNSTGIIDSDYYNNEDNEGHIMIALLNFGKEIVTLDKGERVAQGIFSKYLITNLTKEVEVGEVYLGKVTRLMAFGAFVEVLPGKEGLVHISKLAKERVENVEDVVNVGDEIMVKVIEIDKQGRVNLSRKDCLK